MSPFFKLLGVAVAAIVLSAAGANAALAQTREVGGVNLDEHIELEGSKLQLNGAGVRYKAIFKLYVAALYTTAPTTSLEVVTAPRTAHRLQIIYQGSRSVEQLGRTFARNIEKSASHEEMITLLPGLISISNGFQGISKVKSGDVLIIDWVPGKGTLILYNGKQVVETIKEPNFNKALMQQWLSESSSDATLRDALLNLPPARSRRNDDRLP